MKKVIPDAFHGDFLLKIGIIWFRDIRTNIPFFKYEGPPLATPTTQYHGIMEYMQFYENTGLDFRYYSFCAYVFVSLHTNLYWNCPNGPILTL